MSRAAKPGSRGASRAVARYAAIAVVALAAIAASVALYLAHSGSGAPPAARYGGMPSWLPTPKVSVGRVATASPARPWLAIEGDSVRVVLPQGQALVTAVGPLVPEEGQFPVPATTPCTFTVTLASVSGTVPLRPAAFTIRDEQGQLHQPKVTLQDGGPLPASAPPGKALTVTITDVLPTGNGQLRWAPQGGSPVVSWDFDVEID